MSDKYTAEQPRPQYQGSAALERLTNDVSFTHSMEPFGGFCSLDMAENVPQQYYFASAKEKQALGDADTKGHAGLTGDFHRTRCCCPTITEWCPGWIPFCPQEQWTEVRDKSGGSRWEVHYREKHGWNLICCPEICGWVPAFAVRDQGEQVFSLHNQGLLAKCFGPCCLCCCGTVTTGRILDSRGDEAFTTRTVPDACCSETCSADLCATCGITACIGPRRCGPLSECSLFLESVSVPMKHSVLVYGPKGTEDVAIGKVSFEGEWEGQHCLCFNCCFSLYDKYNIDVQLPSGPRCQKILGDANPAARQSVLALAMWYDYNWIMPHVEVPCGPVPFYCPVSTPCHCF